MSQKHQSQAAPTNGLSLPRRVRNRLPLAAAFATSVALGGLAPATALAASQATTSVAVRMASPGALAGNVASARPSCVKGRTVELQVRKSNRWVNEAATRTSSTGRFSISLHGARAGHFRISVTAHGACAGTKTSRISSPLPLSPTLPTRVGPRPGTGSTATHPVTATPTSTPSSPSTPSTPAPTCALPLSHDTTDGYHVGVPSGWEVLDMHGQLEVAPSPTADEAVLIIPAAQANGLTASSFFQSELPAFESELANAPTVTSQGTQDGEPYVNFTVTANGATGQGTATIVTRQSGADTELDFVAYWAPQSSYATESTTLSAIVGCYGPETGNLFQVYQDQAFTYVLPPSWTVNQETSDMLTLTDPQGDIVSYEQVAGTQFTTPQSLASLVLSMDGETGVSTVWDTSSAAQNGGLAGYEQEFTATLNGTPTHGIIYAATQTSAGFSTGYFRLVISAASNWNAMNGVMINMVGSIQHDFTQDLQMINQLNQQWQNFSGQVANFDDTLNNQQLVQNPATGKLYEAPYSAYSDGPQGPGYYLSTAAGPVLLNQVSH
jgi:hypothetical protein